MTDGEKFDAAFMAWVNSPERGLTLINSDVQIQIEWKAWQAALASQQPADDSRNEMLSMPDMVTAQDMRETLNILLHEEEAEAAATGFNQCLMECAPIYEAYIRRSRCIDELVKELDGMQESLNAKHRSFVAARNRADLAEKKLAEPNSQQPADDGWIDWAGGRRPVPPGNRVDLKLRGGVITKDYLAECARWSHHKDNNSSDIIAYRVVKP